MRTSCSSRHACACLAGDRAVTEGDIDQVPSTECSSCHVGDWAMDNSDTRCRSCVCQAGTDRGYFSARHNCLSYHPSSSFQTLGNDFRAAKVTQNCVGLMALENKSKVRVDAEQSRWGLDRAEVLVYRSISNAHHTSKLQEHTGMQIHARMFGSDSHTCRARTSVTRHKSSARLPLFFVS